LAAPGYLTRRKLGWYFQIAVPKDLQSQIGKKSIRISLKTQHRKEAERLKRPLLDEYQLVFAEMRANRITPERRAVLVARLDALGYSVDADQIDAKLVEWIVSFETRNAEHRMAYRRAQLDSLGLPIDVEAALGPTKAGLAARQRQVEEVAAAVNGKPIARRGGGITLDDLFDRWKRERNPAPRSIDECEFTVRRFRELYGRPAINEITRQQVRDFREGGQTTAAGNSSAV
jgi:hypothetical protein